MKKYELTDETKEYYGRTLYRIRAIRDFGDVKAGDIGGFVETEGNLSHDGNAWVYDEAKVYGDAMVYGDAKVCEYAEVYGNAMVYEYAWIYGDARVYGDAKVCEYAEVCSTRHYFVMGPAGSENRYTTFYRGSDHAIHVKCGCFSGSLEDFKKKVSETHGGTKFEKEYMLAAELAETCIDLGGEND